MKTLTNDDDVVLILSMREAEALLALCNESESGIYAYYITKGKSYLGGSAFARPLKRAGIKDIKALAEAENARSNREWNRGWDAAKAILDVETLG
jgi:hypothetical protein